MANVYKKIPPRLKLLMEESSVKELDSLDRFLKSKNMSIWEA
ncbi:hypothetical protein EW15_1521 [Prochlorococcus sp. MIT 0801]|nr:hypothetical protein EW15_1521 [Prochlorococcus sp. MIT 0801]